MKSLILLLAFSALFADTISVPIVQGTWNSDSYLAGYNGFGILESHDSSFWTQAGANKERYFRLEEHIGHKDIIDSFTVSEINKIRQANGDTTWAIALPFYGDTVYSALKCYRKLASDGTIQLDSTKIYRASTQMKAWYRTTTLFDSTGVSHYRIVATKNGLYFRTKTGSIGYVNKDSCSIGLNRCQTLWSDGENCYFNNDSSIYRWTSYDTKQVVTVLHRTSGPNGFGIALRFGIDWNDTTVYYQAPKDSNYLWYSDNISTHAITHTAQTKIDSTCEITWKDNHLWIRNNSNVIKIEKKGLFIEYRDIECVTGFHPYIVNEDTGRVGGYGILFNPYNIPSISVITDTLINVNSLYSVTLTVTGENPIITATLPSWLTLTASTISGTPVHANVGDTVITVIASDVYGGADTLSYPLHVINHAPVLSAINDTTIAEGDTLKLTASATDPDGDPLTYSWSVDASPYPDSILPTSYNDSGVKTVSVIVSDGLLTDTATFTVHIVNINRAPVLSAISNMVITEGDTLKLTASATDPDSDPLTYAWFVDASAYSDSIKFEFPTSFNDSGVKTVSVIASDGLLADTATFTVHIGNSNRIPVILNTIDTLTTENDGSANFILSATDTDGDNLIFWGENGLITTVENIDSIFSITENTRGVYDTIILYVSDGMDTVSFKLSVYRPLSTGNESLLPTVTFCANAFPNPFNPSTTISYGVAKPSTVSIVVYNLRGSVVKAIESGYKGVGYYNASWNATVSSGVYILKVKIGNYSKVSKIILEK